MAGTLRVPTTNSREAETSHIVKLKGKIAIVTGASRGIGREIALGYAREGAGLVVTARDEVRLQSLVAEIEQLDCRAIAVRGDVANEADVQRLVDLAIEAFGRIDVLCNNAGVVHRGPVDEMPVDAWDEITAVNLRGPFLCTRAVLPHMKRQKYGRIVDVSSGAAIHCEPGLAAYAASKAGLNAFNRTLSHEVADFNILVNAMSPGAILTDGNPQGTKPPTAPVPTAVFLASLPDDGPTGRFFRFEQEMEVIPRLDFDWTS